LFSLKIRSAKHVNNWQVFLTFALPKYFGIKINADKRDFLRNTATTNLPAKK